jgi:hypothetical protein
MHDIDSKRHLCTTLRSSWLDVDTIVFVKPWHDSRGMNGRLFIQPDGHISKT